MQIIYIMTLQRKRTPTRISEVASAPWTRMNTDAKWSHSSSMATDLRTLLQTATWHGVSSRSIWCQDAALNTCLIFPLAETAILELSLGTCSVSHSPLVSTCKELQIRPKAARTWPYTGGCTRTSRLTASFAQWNSTWLPSKWVSGTWTLAESQI